MSRAVAGQPTLLPPRRPRGTLDEASARRAKGASPQTVPETSGEAKARPGRLLASAALGTVNKWHCASFLV
jgi:hypothetical protein